MTPAAYSGAGSMGCTTAGHGLPIFEHAIYRWSFPRSR